MQNNLVVHKGARGFTLIELSIVLVIIGLIVGGIVVGQDLISAAAVRAQIAQINKYNSAVHTFRNKYGGLPGDLNSTLASQFGFVARAGSQGRGDGNGELDGFYGTTIYAWDQNGENLLFWEDLSSAGYIDGTFNSYVDGTSPTCFASCSLYLPPAKIGGGNVVYVYSGYAAGCCTGDTGIGPNFFGVNVIPRINSTSNVGSGSAPGLTVSQAYSIDKKIDDGMPTTGKVMTQYLTNSSSGEPGWSTNGSTPSSTTCYDTSSGVAAYSTSYSGGTNNINCGLSFQLGE